MSEKGKTKTSTTIAEQSDRESVSSGASEFSSNVGKPAKTEHAAGNDGPKNTVDGGYRDSQAVYRDYSRDKTMLMSSDEARESAQTFPMKLHSILSNPEFSNIVSWLPHGRAFRILQHKAFEEKVIPLYFRHGRYSSFARQVNGWGFKRIAHGPDYNSYYHELFLRGIPRLCEKMKRLSGKEEKKNEENPDSPVPDFYALSRQNPLPEDNDDFHAPGSLESTTRESNRTGNGYGFTGLGNGNLSSLLTDAQAGGGNTSVGSNGAVGDILGGLVLQALELRRNEIMQRLSSLVTEGFSSSLSMPQASVADPLSSIISLLTAQQHAGAPVTPSGSIADLVTNLLQNGSNVASAARQSAASAGTSFQGLQHFTNKAATGQAGGGLDILTLLKQQQEYQHSKPAAQASLQSSVPGNMSDLQQQLMNNPSTAALLQQLQGNALGNNSPSTQAPTSQMYSANAPHLLQGPSGALQFRSAVSVPSGETRHNSDTPNISSGNSTGFQLPPGVDISSLLNGGPNVLANLASLLQNQRPSGDNNVGAPAHSASMSQHKESQTRSPQFSALNGPCPSDRSPPQQNSAPAPRGLPATIASLLGQMQQNRGQFPSNTAALMGQLSQQNRLGSQEVVSQDQNMMRQHQQSRSMNSQVSQIQALLGQQGLSSDWQALLGQNNSASTPSQGVDIRAQLQRQQIPDQSGQGILGLQSQLMGGGNLSMEQLQLAALLGLGSQSTCNK